MKFSRNIYDAFASNGDGEIRTLDPLLARQVLSQLSYAPIDSGIHLLSHVVSNIVSSAAYVLTFVFGMWTGVSHKRIDTRNIEHLTRSFTSLVRKLFFATWRGFHEPSAIEPPYSYFE